MIRTVRVGLSTGFNSHWSNNKNNFLCCNKSKAFTTVGSECKHICRQRVFCFPAQYFSHPNHNLIFCFLRSKRAFFSFPRELLEESQKHGLWHESPTWEKHELLQTWTCDMSTQWPCTISCLLRAVQLLTNNTFHPLTPSMKTNLYRRNGSE